MTEAMPFLQKTILLSYDPRPFGKGFFPKKLLPSGGFCAKMHLISGKARNELS